MDVEAPSAVGGERRLRRALVDDYSTGRVHARRRDSPASAVHVNSATPVQDAALQSPKLELVRAALRAPNGRCGAHVKVGDEVDRAGHRHRGHPLDGDPQIPMRKGKLCRTALYVRRVAHPGGTIESSKRRL
jgi:hypothetical protein